MNLATTFLQHRCEVGTPSEVASCEGEENLEGSDILELGDHFILQPLKILGGPWDLVKDGTWVFQLVAKLSPWSNVSLALHPREVGIVPQPLCLHYAHGTEDEARSFSKPLIDIEDSLVEKVLSSEFH